MGSSFFMVLAAAALVLGGGGCSSGSTVAAPGADTEATAPAGGSGSATPEGAAPGETAMPEPEPGSVRTVLGHVAFQRHRVTIYSSDAGPRYRLSSDQGAVLAESMDEAEFQERFPELFEAFETAQAEHLDASHVEPPTDRPVPGH